MSFRGVSACLFLMGRSVSGFAPMSIARPCSIVTLRPPLANVVARSKSSVICREMSTGTGEAPPIRHINKEEMKQIIMEHEELLKADLESPYCVIDVRTQGEVQQTGKISPVVPTLPVQVMMPPYNALQMDDEDFEEAFGFAKPSKDLVLVFSCAAGIRSVSACKAAQMAGYEKCVNYMGGAQEWFYS